MLPSGTRLGPYEVVAPLGAGGMGEVYVARDSRLDRRVALKILPTQLANVERRRRFEREARAISQLSHPHICTLYDFGQEDGLHYLVMEYLEGDPLDRRLKRGALPITEMLRAGREIASALEAAHRQGIVHRDLKPGNVVLTRAGAKLLDFGLARYGTSSADAATLTEAKLTTDGAVLGTLQYMSPEQVEGHEADVRTDIFALGALLHEMATGRPAFTGPSSAALAAAILHSEPLSIGSLRPDAPPALQPLVQVCLAKNPEDRWQSAHDIELQLGVIERERVEVSGGSTTAVSPLSRRSGRWRKALIVFAAAGIAAVTFLTATYLRNPSANVGPVVRASLLPPTPFSFLPYNFALSPDGSRLAFAAIGTDGSTSIWVRPLSAASAQQLSSSEGGSSPFWAPDNRRVAFFASSDLKVVDTSDGSERSLCPVPQGGAGRGGSWNGEDTIIFGSAVSGPMYRVPASGGLPQPITQPSGSQSDNWPWFLPDGKHFLFFRQWSSVEQAGGNGIFVGSLDGGTPKRIAADITGNTYFANGYLLYVKDRSLIARSFNAKTLGFVGAPVRLLDREIRPFVASSASDFTVSQSGSIVFRSTADSDWQLTWLDSNGKETESIPQQGCKDPSLSPDGRQLAVACDDARNGQYSIHVIDLARGINTRLTTGGDDEFPTWSPDGKGITYLVAERTGSRIEAAAADGSRPPRKLLGTGNFMIPNSWSPDGQRLALMNFIQNGRPELQVFVLSTQKLGRLAEGAEAQYSPDGKWISYLGGSTGTWGDIIVQSTGESRSRIPISSGGGSQARWSRDGKHLYYLTRDRKLMEVTLAHNSSGLVPSAPRKLFQTRISSPTFALFQYDVSRDGQRFVISSFPDKPMPLTLLTNWPAALKK